jgi:hypothetical protein
MLRYDRTFFLTNQVQIADGVLMQEQEGEAFLLHVASGRYFGLNKTGVLVWRAIEAGTDPVDAVASKWPDVPRDRCAQDVEVLVRKLVDAGLALDG